MTGGAVAEALGVEVAATPAGLFSLIIVGVAKAPESATDPVGVAVLVLVVVVLVPFLPLWCL
jgi:hypothetical protein